MLRMIAEADYFGNRVQVLKFIEVFNEGETQRIKSPRHLKKQGFLSPVLQPMESPERYEGSINSLEDEVGEGSGKEILFRKKFLMNKSWVSK